MENKNTTTPRERFIERIRTKGAWAIVLKDDEYIHYMISKNRKTGLAISLCWRHTAKLAKIQYTRKRNYCPYCKTNLNVRKEMLSGYINLRMKNSIIKPVSIKVIK